MLYLICKGFTDLGFETRQETFFFQNPIGEFNLFVVIWIFSPELALSGLKTCKWKYVYVFLNLPFWQFM